MTIAFCLRILAKEPWMKRQQLLRMALQKFNNPAFILCSTLLAANGKILDGESLVRSIENTVGPQVNMYGGMAGDDITFTGTYVFTNNTLIY